MPIPLPSPLWAAFRFSSSALPASAIPAAQRPTRFRVEQVVPVTGAAPTLPPHSHLLRLESASPIGAPAEPEGAPGLTLFGVTQQLLYTSSAQRDDLAQRTHAEFPPGPETAAVLIPIAKSPDWWALAQDERNAHFQPGAGREGHTAIGYRFSDRVFRRLYHSRSLPAARGYDFLTYFEFERRHAPDFRELLAALRDPALNPEWRDVTLEYEVWLNKVG